jgi:RHS repeat-associated protein
MRSFSSTGASIDGGQRGWHRWLAVVTAAALVLTVVPPPSLAEPGPDATPSREELRERSTVAAESADELGTASVQTTATEVTPVPRDAAGAARLAEAMVRDDALVTDARFVAVPPNGTPHGVTDTLSWFPTRGEEFGILTTGDATLAPDTSAFASVDLGGGNVRGNTDFDVTVLALNLDVPAGANCLRFDFGFYSEEYPVYVGSAYNDAFIAELGTSTWTTSGSTIIAPDNFAFDPTGAPVSINSTGVTSMNAALAAGTTYGGGSELLQAGTPLAASGSQTLYLSIFDQGDRILDSAVFLDDLHVTQVRDPATMCISGVKRPGDLPPLRREQTWGQGTGTHGVNPSGTQSDPVNSATGAFVTAAVDLEIPAVGVPFSLVRSYTSEDDREGPLGPGWTHNLDVALLAQPGGDVVLRGEDGQQLSYRLEDDGSYVPGPGVRSQLRAVEDGYELLRTDQVVYRFDGEGLLLAIVDPNGMGLEVDRDGAEIAAVTDSGGRTVVFDHQDGRLVRVQTADGREVAFDYTDGLLTSVTDARGQTVTYEYDAGGRLSLLRDAAGQTIVANTYGADGRVVEQTDGLDNTTTFAWDPDEQTATMTDPQGGTHVDRYEGFVLVARQDPLGNLTTLDHDDDINVVTVTDPRGHAIELSWDLAGNLLQLRAPAPLSFARNWEYDDRNNVTAAVDGRGQLTTYDYDEANNLVRIEHPDGAVESFDRDPLRGVVVAATDPLGAVTTLDYDAEGNNVRTTSPLGRVTQIEYDAAGRPVAIITDGVDGEPATLELRYDGLGNILTATDPSGATTTRTYDERGLPASETDALGRTTGWEHDVLGRLLQVVDPEGAITSYGYDAIGSLVQRVDPLGRTTTYEHDAAGRLTEVRSAAGQRWTFEYDDNGNVIRTVDPVGHATEREEARTTVYEYDALNRVTAIGYADDAGMEPEEPIDPDDGGDGPGDPQGGPATELQLRALCSPDPDTTRRWRIRNTTDQTITAEWELIRTNQGGTHTAPPGDSVLTTQAQRGNNTLRLSWPDDSMIRGSGRVTCKAGQGGGGELPVPTTPSVSFGYDENSNRVSMLDGAGVVSYSYDERDRLVAVERGEARYAYTHDVAGRVTSRDLPDGRTLAFAYDADGRPVEVAEGGQVTTFAWGDDGRLAQLERPNGTSELREHDLAGRLASVRHVDDVGEMLASFVYTRDAVGNPTTVTTPDEVRTHTYDDRDQLVETCFDTDCTDSIAYAYDLVGNRQSEQTSAGTTTFDYDEADRLLRAVGPDGSVDYTYDENGNRTRAGAWRFAYDVEDRLSSATDGSTHVVYGYDGEGRRVSATGPGRSTVYSWDVNARVPTLAAEFDADGEVLRGYSHGVGLQAVTVGDDRLELHADAVGSVTAITGGAGELLTSTTYEPFGALRSTTAGQALPADVPIGFAGGYLDPTTGLYHLGARDYDPQTGRFTRIDPIAQAVEDPYVAAYVYANNQPTLLTDPTGLCPWCVLAGVGAVVGGVVSGSVYALTTDEFSWRQLGGAVAGGAVAGAVTAVAGPVGGTVALKVGATSTGGVALATTAGINAVGGTAAMSAQTGVGQGRWPTAGEAAAGALINVAGGAIGGRLYPMRGVHTMAQVPHFAPRTWGGLVSGRPNISALYGSALTGAGFGAVAGAAFGVPGSGMK